MRSEKTESPSEPLFEVVWPLGRYAGSPAMKLGAPLTDLSGKTIGELWNHGGDTHMFFPLIREALQQRFPDIKFVHYDQFGDFHGQHEHEVIAALPEKLRHHGVDAVISGVGV